MSVEVVPVMRPDDIAHLPVEQRGELITGALVESKKWLEVATRGTDPTPIAEFKAWAATVAEMTKQKGLAQEIQLDALEMVRRAERGIGLAIRNGQEVGVIAKRGDVGGNGQRGALGAVPGSSRAEDLGRPSDFFSGGGTQHETYAMTDGVTDEQFEEALEEARDEGNLARRNVIRKIKENETFDSGGEERKVQAQERQRRHYVRSETLSRDAIASFVTTVSGLAMALRDVVGIDPDISEFEAQAYAREISKAVTQQRTLVRLLKERKA